MNIYLKGKRIYVDPAKSIGKGNEADIFDIGSGMVLKLFKPPEHPDYQGLPDEEEGEDIKIHIGHLEGSILACRVLLGIE